MTAFEVIVIEENISSLMTACLLQHNGINMLIFENNKNTISKVFESMYYWDPEKGALGVALKKLGIDNTLIGKKVKYTDRLVLNDILLLRDSDCMMYFEKLKKLFPYNEEEIRRLFNDMQQVSEEWIRLLNAGSVFTAGPLKQMMKFRNNTYVDYLEKNIKNNQLKELLMLDCDKNNTAFVVIAGYVLSQIMDGYIVDDVDTVYSLLRDYFVNEGGEIIVDNYVSQITKEDDRYLICDGNGNIFSSEIIVTPHTEKIFREKFFGEFLYNDLEDIETQYIIIDGVLPNPNRDDLCVREKLYYVETNVKCILNVLITHNRLLIKVCSEDKLIIYDDLINFICDKYKINSTKKIDIYDNDRLEREIGVSARKIQGWEFDSKQMQNNIMEIGSASKGLYALGEWGCAFFTVAICAANTIIKRRKRK